MMNYKWVQTFDEGIIHIPDISENHSYLFNVDSEYYIYTAEDILKALRLKQLPRYWFSKPVPNFNNDSWVRRSIQPYIKPNKDKIYLSEYRNSGYFTFVDADEIMNNPYVLQWLNDENFYPLFKEFVIFPNLLKR